MQKENFSKNKACRHRKAKMYRKNKEAKSSAPVGTVAFCFAKQGGLT